jgi:WD40 repeat protein
LRFSPDGKTVAVGGSNIELRDASTGLITATFPAACVSLAFSPDAKILASQSADGPVTIWDVATGKAIHELAGGRPSVFGRNDKTVAFSADGKTLAAASEKTVRLWDVATGKPLNTLDCNEGGKGSADLVARVAFSPNGKFVASWTKGSSVRIWDAATGKGALIPSKSQSMAFSPDSTMLATGGVDKKVALWETASGKKMGDVSGHTASVSTVCFSPDGKKLVSGDTIAQLFIWNISPLTMAGKFRGSSAPHYGYEAAFCADGELLAVPLGSTIEFLAFPSGERKKSINE